MISCLILAVDNVLERFIKINADEGLLLEEQVLRVATDVTKVNQSAPELYDQRTCRWRHE